MHYHGDSSKNNSANFCCSMFNKCFFLFAGPQQTAHIHIRGGVHMKKILQEEPASLLSISSALVMNVQRQEFPRAITVFAYRFQGVIVGMSWKTLI